MQTHETVCGCVNTDLLEFKIKRLKSPCKSEVHLVKRGCLWLSTRAQPQKLLFPSEEKPDLSFYEFFIDLLPTPVYLTMGTHICGLLFSTLCKEIPGAESQPRDFTCTKAVTHHCMCKLDVLHNKITYILTLKLSYIP